MAYMVRVFRFIFYAIIAAMVTTLLASFISTQRVLSAINDIGVPIAFSDRFSTAAYDLQHFGPLYGLFILVAFLIAFFVGQDLGNKYPRLRIYWLVGAGIVAIYVMLFLMKQVFFGVPIVAGARDGLGLFLQMLAGGAGGYVFYLLTKPKPDPEAQD